MLRKQSIFCNLLKKHMQQKLNQINQEVIMTDVITKQTPYESTGEFSYESIYQDQVNHLTRMKDHIELLASIANQYHLNENFYQDKNNEFIIKSDSKNKITRLIMHEFSLYPAKHPLSVKEFNQLYSDIEQIAAKMSDNLYLIISSIPVACDEKDGKSQVVNYVVHVQCGKYPKMELLTKINPSIIDPVYTKTHNMRYQEHRKETSAAAAILLADNNQAASAQSYGRIVKCETAGGSCFHSAVDICLDYVMGQGKKNFNKEIELIAQAENNELIPDQISHVITSNSVDYYHENDLTDSIIRSDPDESYSMYKNTALTLTDDLTKNIPDDCKQYTEMAIYHSADYKIITINQPPFGSKISIEIYPPYPLNRLDGNLKTQINDHNNNILNQYPIDKDNFSPSDEQETKLQINPRP